MKKIITFSAALVLGICAFGTTRNVRAANATLDNDQVTAMKEMMGKYINAQGRYTKKSRIFVKKDIPGYEASIFHAGHDVLERTTYYDGVDGLLMCNLDGSFETINSGYANDGEGNMIHFISEDGIAGLTSENRTVDYKVTGKTMADYFYNLNDLINSIAAGDWGYNEGNYFHDITDLTVDSNGDYNDKVLKRFQYFAAPMLLQDGAEHYLSPQSIVVNENAGYLHICLYASNADEGKLSSGSNLLADTKVYSGFVTPDYYLVGNLNGNSGDWQIDGGRPLIAPQEGTDLGVILNAPIKSDTEFQIVHLKDDGDSEWINNTPLIADYPFAEKNDNNILIKYSGSYNIYLNSESKIYLERKDHRTVTFNFVYTDADWSAWNPRPDNFALHLTSDQNGSVHVWGSDEEKMTNNDGTYTIEVEFNGTITGAYFYFYQGEDEKKTTNILGSTVIQNHDVITINVNVGGFVWTDGQISSGVSLTIN